MLLAIDTEGTWGQKHDLIPIKYHVDDKVLKAASGRGAFAPPVRHGRLPRRTKALCGFRVALSSVAGPPTSPCKVHGLCVLHAGDLCAVDSQHHVSNLEPGFLSGAVCKWTDNKGLIEEGSQIECPAVCPLFKRLFL